MPGKRQTWRLFAIFFINFTLSCITFSILYVSIMEIMLSDISLIKIVLLCIFQKKKKKKKIFITQHEWSPVIKGLARTERKVCANRPSVSLTMFYTECSAK